MSDTFNEFVEFISEDPLMMGLCIAIVVLVIIFILVLCLGRKKKPVQEKVENNTQEILDNSSKEEPLKSTQEYNLNSIQNASNTQTVSENMTAPSEPVLDKTINVPNVEAVTDDLMEKEAPINIEEAMNLKNSRENNETKDTIEVPVVNNTSSEKVEIPTPTMQVNSNVSNEPIIPEVSNTVVDDELPTMINPVVKEEPVSERTQPFSSVYVNQNDELPKNNYEDFSKTEIIRHTPVMESAESKVNEEAKPQDIDLPKLNNDSNTSVLNSLSGESFDINNKG